MSAGVRWCPLGTAGCLASEEAPDLPVALGNDADVTSSMSAVGKLEAPSCERAAVAAHDRGSRRGTARRTDARLRPRPSLRGDRRPRRAPGDPPRQLPARSPLGAPRARAQRPHRVARRAHTQQRRLAPRPRRRAGAHQPARPRNRSRARAETLRKSSSSVAERASVAPSVPVPASSSICCRRPERASRVRVPEPFIESSKSEQTSARERAGAWGAVVLRVTTLHASSAAATAKYYAEYLTAAPGEVPGVWAGRQADGLGLAGRGHGRAARGAAVGP